MVPYFVILALPSLVAFSSRSTAHRVLLPTVAVIFIGFVGLRYEVGPDWNGYMSLHYVVSTQAIGDILVGREPLSMLLFRLSALSGVDMLLSNVVSSSILIIGIVALARRTPNPSLALVAATPYLVIAFGMSGIRQAM